MKNILLVLFLLSSFLYAEIDERKSDVYFANGIDTKKEDADESLRILNKKFKSSNPKTYKSIKTWDVVYNHTHGIGIDLYESMIQKVYEDAPGDSIVPFIWNANSILDYLNILLKESSQRLRKKFLKKL